MTREDGSLERQGPTPAAPGGIITLTTDFGHRGYHVGAVKGAILSRNPGAVIVDLCHGIPSGDIAEGAWTLLWNWRCFPPGTVHLAVVDPGVGTSRRAIAASAGGHFFTAPDNGLLAPVLEASGSPVAFTIAAAAGEGPISRTFHGRDVFAPAAASLALGVPLPQIGTPAGPIVPLELPRPRREGRGVLSGEIISIDPFGNLVTSITAADLEGGGFAPGADIEVGGRPAGKVRSLYADVAPGEPLGLINSSGHLELAVNRGRADDLHGARKGDEVRLRDPRAQGPGG